MEFVDSLKVILLRYSVEYETCMLSIPDGALADHPHLLFLVHVLVTSNVTAPWWTLTESQQALQQVMHHSLN